MTTLARLSFWIPPDRDIDFAETFEKKALPLLQEHGLTQPALDPRPAVAGVFSRLFDVESPLAVPSLEHALEHDLHWQQGLQAWGDRFGSSAEDGRLRAYLGLYATPAGPGRTMEAGAGTRRGLWYSLGVQDGLGSSQAYQILQDRQGTLWISTTDGLSRYDGTMFVHFTPADGLAHAFTGALAGDASGHLWISFCGYHRPTHKGLGCYDGQTFHTYSMADGLADNGVRSLCVDRQDRLWIGTFAGLSCYDGQQFITFTTDDGLPHPSIGALYEDRHGRLWLGTSTQVCYYAEGRFTVFSPEETGLHTRAWSFQEDAEGRLWLGGLDGVCWFDGARFHPFVLPESLEARGAGPRGVDREGGLWLSAFPHGLVRYDGTTCTTFTQAEGLPTNQVEGVCPSPDGAVWVATTGGGISRYDGHRFTHYTTREGLLDNGLYFIWADRQGQLWAGTFRGLCRYDGRRWQAELRVPTFHEAPITLREDRHGRLWGVTHQGTLLCRQGEEWATVRPGLLSTVYIGSLAEDGQGHLWCANGSDGVWRYDGQSWTLLTTQDGLVDNGVRQVGVDRQGQVWLGTVVGGISRFDGERFETVTTGEELGFHEVLCLYEDRVGHLWIGTAGAGVVRYDGSKFTRWTTADGLVCDRVTALAEDDQGHLWLGTQGGGVSRYDGQVFQRLSQRDGLSHDVVKGLLPDGEGGMWLATEGGVTHYRSQAVSPSVRLREVVADQTYVPEAPIHLSQSQQVVRIAFQGHSAITGPEGLVYVYRLQGYETDWQVTRQRHVSYRMLPRGDYTFQVKAVDGDLNYSAPAEGVLQVEPDPRQQALQELLSGEGESFVGQSPALAQVQQQLAQVAGSNLTALILGETGTGKGLAARTLHRLSRRRDGPFVPVNSGALPEHLVESELFGHERGSFTGAHARKLGKVELAAKGTLFLDEIGDMSPEAQIRLLRLLEEGTYERVGGTEWLKAEVRVVAATNRDLGQMVEEGTFREDLFFRLNVFPVTLPPLRERQEDIPLLVEYFMDRMAAHLHKPVRGITSEALARLKRYPWPGNVRELQHTVERAVIVCAGEMIQAEDITLGTRPQEPEPAAESEWVSLAEHERRYLRQVLEKTNGVIKGPQGAAAILGVSSSTVHYRIKKLGLRPPRE